MIAVDRAEMLNDAKQRINNLLWVILPESTTLRRAEAIACDIHALVQKEWDAGEGGAE